MKRENKPVRHHHAQLLVHYHLCLAVKPDHFQDNEQIVVIVIDFRPLARIEDVFEYQGMQIKHRSDPADVFYIVQSVNVDPGHGSRGFLIVQILDISDFFFSEVMRIIVDEPDVHGIHFLRTHKMSAPGLCPFTCSLFSKTGPWSFLSNRIDLRNSLFFHQFYKNKSGFFSCPQTASGLLPSLHRYRQDLRAAFKKILIMNMNYNHVQRKCSA